MSTDARARIVDGNRLEGLGRLEDALAVFASFAELALDLAQEELVALALHAGYREAELLDTLGRPDEALARTRATLERFSGARGPDALAQTVSMLEQYAIGLAAAGRVDEAIAAHERLSSLLPGLDAPTSRGREAASLVERASLLLERGDSAVAADALRSVFARFSRDTDARTTRLTAFAGMRATHELALLGRSAEAVELSHAVFARFDGSDDAYIQDCVRSIRTGLRREGRAMRLVRRSLRS